MLHQSFLEGLVPTVDRCMSILLARYWILHDHLFVNRYMKENSTISTDCLFQPGIDPVVHQVAWIRRTFKRGKYHVSKDFSILFVLEPRSYIDWKRAGLNSMRNLVVEGVVGVVTAIVGAGADLIAVVTACTTAVAISVDEAGAGAGAAEGAAVARTGGAAGGAGVAKPVAESVVSVPHCRQFNSGQKCKA